MQAIPKARMGKRVQNFHALSELTTFPIIPPCSTTWKLSESRKFKDFYGDYITYARLIKSLVNGG